VDLRPPVVALLRDGPWFGAMPLLAAAAACTSRIRLGPLVATPNFRHPVPFAKEVMTLDHLAGGRLDLGVGAGADGPDAAVLGDNSLAGVQRADRFRDWVELLVALLERETVTATSGPYAAVDARMIPGCHQRPRVPLTVAAAGPRGMELATRFADTWVTYGDPRRPAEDGHDLWLSGLRRQSSRLDDVAAATGRPRPRAAAVIRIADTAPFESVRRLDDTLGRLGEAGFDEIYALWPRPDGTGVPRGLVDHLLNRCTAPEESTTGNAATTRSRRVAT